MKLLLALFIVLTQQVSFAQSPAPEAANKSVSQTAPSKTYGLHLFFNEQEFIDVLVLSRTESGALTGFMHVPNDFDGAIENVQLTGLDLTFDLFVPKNAARPRDLIFHYKGRFFDESQKQLIGFVTLKGQSDFTASFVAFLREQKP